MPERKPNFYSRLMALREDWLTELEAGPHPCGTPREKWSAHRMDLLRCVEVATKLLMDRGPAQVEAYVAARASEASA